MGVAKNDQMSLFQEQDIENYLNSIAKECFWVPNHWSKDYWHYQDEDGYTMSDDYGRHTHDGTFLPMVIQQNYNQ